MLAAGRAAARALARKASHAGGTASAAAQLARRRQSTLSAREAEALKGFPTVDVGGLFPDASVERRAAAHAELRNALVDENAPGFFYALNAPETLNAKYLDSVYAFVEDAHSLPLRTKARFADPKVRERILERRRETREMRRNAEAESRKRQEALARESSDLLLFCL